MDKIKIEIPIIVFSIIIVGGLGIRFDIETDKQADSIRIIQLEAMLAVKEQVVANLKTQLKPLPYSQPVKQIRVSSATGIRTNPMGGGAERLHRGLDLAASKGTPVYAVLAGEVIEHYLVPGWHNHVFYKGHPVMGCMITIKHEDGLYSIYGHLSESYVKEGQSIKMGQLIGLVGSTGISSGNHLHWEMVIDGFKYLKERR